MRTSIATSGEWSEPVLGLLIKVIGIGGSCLSPCVPVIKAILEIKTESYIIPNYAAVVGFSHAFTHKNKSYKFMVDEIKTNPAYVIIVLDEINS
jgi:hypothetical protein